MPLEYEILNFRFEIGFRLKGIAEDRTCLALELIRTEREFSQAERVLRWKLLANFNFKFGHCLPSKIKCKNSLTRKSFKFSIC